MWMMEIYIAFVVVAGVRYTRVYEQRKGVGNGNR
jgi:hypothetical protein